MNVHQFIMSFMMLFILTSFFVVPSNSYSTDVHNNHSELLDSEKNTIGIFQQASPKVVYVQRLALVKNKNIKKQYISDGTGSGIIWDNAGHVVTNYHVIKGAHKIIVGVGDVMVSAKVVGAEPRKDLAVLLLLASLKTFKPLDIAPTQELQVGQKAIAIGNPFGLDHTLTIGVISALDREFPGIGGVSIRGVIQTDASINPGNSGGPLLDSMGRLIGLNSAIYSQSGSSAGIGFAIPSNDVVQVVTQIIQHGRVVLSGIGIERLDVKTAQKLGVNRGIAIARILPDTPAAKAGLLVTHPSGWGKKQLGDVITAINHHEVYDYDEFYNELAGIKVGEEIMVTVIRNGKHFNHKMKTIDIASY